MIYSGGFEGIGCLRVETSLFISSSSSQNALLLLQTAGIAQTYSQSGLSPFVSGQWCSSDIIAQFSSNHSVLRWRLSHAPFHASPAPMLRLSAVAMETLLNWVRSGACWNPQHPLKDWTAPPSLSSDHWYLLIVLVFSLFM